MNKVLYITYIALAIGPFLPWIAIDPSMDRARFRAHLPHMCSEAHLTKLGRHIWRSSDDTFDSANPKLALGSCVFYWAFLNGINLKKKMVWLSSYAFTCLTQSKQFFLKSDNLSFWDPSKRHVLGWQSDVSGLAKRHILGWQNDISWAGKWWCPNTYIYIYIYILISHGVCCQLHIV